MGDMERVYRFATAKKFSLLKMTDAYGLNGRVDVESSRVERRWWGRIGWKDLKFGFGRGLEQLRGPFEVVGALQHAYTCCL